MWARRQPQPDGWTYPLPSDMLGSVRRRAHIIRPFKSRMGVWYSLSGERQTFLLPFHALNRRIEHTAARPHAVYDPVVLQETAPA